ncbi:hypothetical protein [Arthrobacter sp. NPDC092385]|uniref:hypothetical protein n=1 Tax=Arthrobacter sp. NPDC092385 TaxID=3363943 RepID=UPI00380C9EC4
MSKANDDARVSGSLQADRDASGGPDTPAGDNPGSVDGAGPATTDSVSPRSSRRAAEAPVDAVPEPNAERELLARARNREALRAFRALVEAQATPGDGHTRIETPTRRQMRLQQSQGRAVAPAADGTAADGTAADGTATGVPRSPVPGGRRDRRRQQASRTPAVGTAEDVATDAAPGMSVEEALSARKAIAEEAGEHLAALQAAGPDDPFSVDLEVLAQQKALAERAAVLNSRARRMQELSEQNQQRRPVSNDPGAADNLSIITPPEFVQVPGGSQSVLRAPATSHIPVVLARPQEPPAAPPSETGTDTGTEGEETAPEHAVIADADAGTQPVQARSAFGLEPLDAMTAGLGRLRRLRYIQYSLLGVGAAALVTGIIMTVSSLNG